MHLQDEIEDMDPSTMSSDDNDLAASANLVDDAGSSPATGDNVDDIPNVVRDAVPEDRSDDAASPADGEKQGQEADAADAQADDENFSDVPFNKHPRFRQLVQQRNTFRQEAQRNQLDAERYQSVQTFLDEQGLTADETAEGLMIMAKMKTDPVGAWKQLKPIVQQLLVAAGEVLPDDLQQMVSEGRMDHGAALEVSRSRALAQATLASRSFDEQRRLQREQQTHTASLAHAAESWAEDRRVKDPNFASKDEAIQKEVLFLIRQEGQPTTPEGVRRMLDTAYRKVNATLRPAPQPAAASRQPVRPVSGGQVAGNRAPAPGERPRSTLDIINEHVGRR